jgi:stage III sporulation protein AE
LPINAEKIPSLYDGGGSSGNSPKGQNEKIPALTDKDNTENNNSNSIIPGKDSNRSEKESNAVMPEIEKYLADNGLEIDDSSIEKITEISPEQILNKLLNTFKEQAAAPFKLMFSLIIIVFICAIISGLSDTVKTGTLANIFSIICVMACVIALSGTLLTAFEDVKNTLINGSNFMLSFIPVYTSVIATSGNVTGAVGFNSIVMLFSDMALYFANYVLIPLLSICFAFSIINSVNPSIKLGGAVDGIGSVTKWGLGFIVTIFTGILSLQTVVGANANALEQKTAKFLVSNAVPIVGGAVSDAYLTVKGSIGMMKTGIGGVGLATIATTLLPLIVSLALYRIVLAICKITADITGISPLQDLFENIGEIFSIIFSITIFFTLMLIISIGVLMI